MSPLNILLLTTFYYWPLSTLDHFLLLTTFYYWPLSTLDHFLLLTTFYSWPLSTLDHFLLCIDEDQSARKSTFCRSIIYMCVCVCKEHAYNKHSTGETIQTQQNHNNIA